MGAGTEGVEGGLGSEGRRGRRVKRDDLRKKRIDQLWPLSPIFLYFNRLRGECGELRGYGQVRREEGEG